MKSKKVKIIAGITVGIIFAVALTLFITLYFIAGFIRLYIDAEKIKYPFALYVGCCTFMIFVWVFVSFLFSKMHFLGNYSQYITRDYYYRNN